MGKLVLWRWSIHPHLTQIEKCITDLVIASSISRLDSFRGSQRP
jgi:hypothetical protein